MNTAGEQDGTSGATTSTSLRTWLRSWRYFFVLLGLTLAVGLFYVEENWRGHRAWLNYQRELQIRGEPAEASSVIPPPVPEDKNFAATPLLAPLFQFIPGSQHWSDTNALTRAQGFAPWYDAAARVLKTEKTAHSNSWVLSRTDLAAWQAAFLAATNKDSKEYFAAEVRSTSIQEVAEGVLAGLSETDPVLEELRANSHRPFSRFDLRYGEANPAAIVLPHLASLKHICQILQLRASAELALGKMDQAYEDIHLIFFITDATRDEPILISHLVRMTEFRMALQPLTEGMERWSEPQLRAFQQRLQRFDFVGDLKRTLAAERVLLGCGVIEYLRRSPKEFSALAGGGGGLPDVIWTAVPGGWFDFEKVNYCRLFDQYPTPCPAQDSRRISPTSTAAADARVADFVAKNAFVSFIRHRTFSKLIMPSLTGALAKTAFAQTGAQAAATACALERFRLAKGDFAESLDALRPGYMERPPSDIIDGQPLRYKRNGKTSYVLYSIGWNMIDDGGIIAAGKSEGEEQKNGDWVWRNE